MKLADMIFIVRSICGKQNPLYAYLISIASEPEMVREYESSRTWCCYMEVALTQGGAILSRRCHKARGIPQDTYFGNDGSVVEMPELDKAQVYPWAYGETEPSARFNLPAEFAW